MILQDEVQTIPGFSLESKFSILNANSNDSYLQQICFGKLVTNSASQK